jgi:uncharacterized membrane protein YbjE (DUF340 family)
LFSVGFSLGEINLKELVTRNLKHIIFPFISVAGSILGALIDTAIAQQNLQYSILSSTAMGFYSLCALMVTNQLNTLAGTLVFTTNMLRELFTILLAPFIIKYFGENALIAVGGSTTMDTSLATIKETLGNEYIPIALINGAVLTILVPLLTRLILHII